MKTPTRELAEHIKSVMGYILDCEAEDFHENPSRDHVYYHAMVVVHGEAYAEYELAEAITHQETP